MKNILLVVRWVVGLLFIFSGLVKANDPLGLSYKMQEFFEVWGMHGLDDYTLALSMVMNVFEVLAGVAVIIGWQMRLFSWLLLLLIIFFTFLTGYALFSGKIKTCGCFGDCLPLTPAQSFGKDIFLLLLILVLFVNKTKTRSALKPMVAAVLLAIVTIGTTFGQFFVLKHLPFVDCLPYKKGSNIIQQMKMPANAIPDSLSIVFTYKKNGKQIEFDQANFPADFDSTYEYIDRHDKVVKKGNGLQPKILDFTLQSMSGTDTTAAIFSQIGTYILVFAKDMDHVERWGNGFVNVTQAALQKSIPIIMVTAQADKAEIMFPIIPILKCDATVIKTAARATPTYLFMQGATVVEKVSYADHAKILSTINNL